MANRGRPKETIQLVVGNDPALHKYASLNEALRKNIGVVAALISPTLLNSESPDDDPDAVPIIEPKPRKRKTVKA